MMDGESKRREYSLVPPEKRGRRTREVWARTENSGVRIQNSEFRIGAPDRSSPHEDVEETVGRHVHFFPAKAAYLLNSDS